MGGADSISNPRRMSTLSSPCTGNPTFVVGLSCRSGAEHWPHSVNAIERPSAAAARNFHLVCEPRQCSRIRRSTIRAARGYEPSRAQVRRVPIRSSNFGNQAGAGGALSKAPERALMFGLRPFIGGSVKITSRCCRKSGAYAPRGKFEQVEQRRLNK
jgi:hypothetical protein